MTSIAIVSLAVPAGAMEEEPEADESADALQSTPLTQDLMLHPRAAKATDDPSESLVLQNGTLPLGSVLAYGKLHHAVKWSGNPRVKYVYEEFNLLGDPSMRVTQLPR